MGSASASASDSPSRRYKEELLGQLGIKAGSGISVKLPSLLVAAGVAVSIASSSGHRSTPANWPLGDACRTSRPDHSPFTSTSRSSQGARATAAVLFYREKASLRRHCSHLSLPNLHTSAQQRAFIITKTKHRGTFGGSLPLPAKAAC